MKPVYVEPEFTSLYEESPLRYVDIGASGGLEKHWKLAEKHLQVIGFEPDSRAFKDLVSGNAGTRKRYLNTALYKEKTTLKYRLNRGQQTSSIFEPNESFISKFPARERFIQVDYTELDVDTLDGQFRSSGIDGADFIKVDTQGSELYVLEGAEQTTRESVLGLEIEVEFSEMYKDQPLFSDVDPYVRKLGFELMDLQNCYWKRAEGKEIGEGRGQLVFGNALYFRIPAELPFEDWKNQHGDRWAQAKCLKYVSICAVYGYFDYALEVLSAGAGLFQEKEAQRLQDWIKSNKRLEYCLPGFVGKRNISEWLYKVWKLFRPKVGGWAMYERQIGNK